MDWQILLQEGNDASFTVTRNGDTGATTVYIVLLLVQQNI